jgi:hypothetical protein
MTYVSRYIYILGSALVNLVLGIYLKLEGRGWRRKLQVVGSLLILTSLVLLTVAFVNEPGRDRGALATLRIRMVHAAWRRVCALLCEGRGSSELTG